MKKIYQVLLGCLLSLPLLGGCSNKDESSSILPTQDTENPQCLAFYPLNDGSYAVSVGNAYFLDEISIPSTYKGKPVTRMTAQEGSKGHFNSGNIKKVHVPSSIKEFDSELFYYYNVYSPEPPVPDQIIYEGTYEQFCQITFKNNWLMAETDSSYFYKDFDLVFKFSNKELHFKDTFDQYKVTMRCGIGTDSRLVDPHEYSLTDNCSLDIYPSKIESFGQVVSSAPFIFKNLCYSFLKSSSNEDVIGIYSGNLYALDAGQSTLTFTLNETHTVTANITVLPAQEFEGIVFNNQTISYDGEAHRIEFPTISDDDTLVTYMVQGYTGEIFSLQSNKLYFTEPGTYQYWIILRKYGYYSKLGATLTIE